MTDEELEHRLTAVENRARSNTHRLNDLEKLTDAVNGMNTNIKLTIQQLENTNKSLEIVTAQNKKQDDRLTALEKAPELSETSSGGPLSRRLFPALWPMN